MKTQLNVQDELITNYGDGPNCLETAISGLSDSALDLCLSSSNWTIRQIVHHLADGDDIWKSFIKQAIGNPGGEFRLAWYWGLPQDKWADLWDYQRRSIGPSVAMLRANRDHMVQLLVHIPGVMEKSLRVRWPKGGEQVVSVRWVVEMQTQHLNDHVSDIGKIRKDHNI